MSSDDRLSGRKTLKVSGILDEFEKDRIKADIDIVSLFESFGVSLTKKGKNYMGRCPWHEDSTPSLSVDKDKGLYNCFGCGESGDAFSLVEKIKGLDFKNALAYLKNLKTNPAPVILKPMETAVTVVSATLNDQTAVTERSRSDQLETSSITFEDIVHHWIERLHHNESAQKYLEGRGLSNKQNHGFFSVGYSDGSLVEKLSEAQKKKLVEIGILNDKGREVFEGFVTVPLVAADNRIKGIYGRSISDASTSSATKKSIKHLYLKGPLHGLINRKSFPIYRDRMILTESVIDAMSLYELDIKNVCACYGTNGFKDEHLKALKENMVKEVVIAFDADEAGRKASSELKERLVVEGFSVKVIEPVIGNGSTGILVKDWNEYLITGMTKIDFETLIDSASSSVPEESNTFKVKKESGVYEFSFSHVTYRVTGVKDVFVQDLRINIKATSGNEFFYDKVDLYSSRSRTSYSSSLSSLFDIEYKRIEKDLVSMLEYLEAERDKALEKSSGSLVVAEPTEEEKKTAMDFLKNPNLFENILSDMSELGYVGEDSNKLLAYLIGASRVMNKPLSLYIQSGSSTGKSLLIDTVCDMLPKGTVLDGSSFSEQALNYMKPEDLEGKILTTGEAIHSEVIEGQIRQMQSEGKISRFVTMKDHHTGQMETKQVKNPVKLVFMITSTALSLNPENASRCLVLHTDESRAQTDRVLWQQRLRRTYEGLIHLMHEVPRIIQKHQTVGRLIKRVAVFNPLAHLIRFPIHRPSMRRAQEQFLTLMEVAAILRQFQKKQVEKINPYTQAMMTGIEVDLEDYALARKLFTEAILNPNADELPPGAKLLYQALQTMAKQKASREGLEITQVTFIQREVRELSELGAESIKKYLKALVDFEYLELNSGRKTGTRFSYRLRDREYSPSATTLLPTVEEIEKEFQKAGKTG